MTSTTAVVIIPIVVSGVKLATKGAVEYRLLQGGRVVYYGITKQPVRNRALQHLRKGKVFDTIEGLIDLPRDKARLVERNLIKAAREIGVELYNIL